MDIIVNLKLTFIYVYNSVSKIGKSGPLITLMGQGDIDLNGCAIQPKEGQGIALCPCLIQTVCCVKVFKIIVYSVLFLGDCQCVISLTPHTVLFFL